MFHIAPLFRKRWEKRERVLDPLPKGSIRRRLNPDDPTSTADLLSSAVEPTLWRVQVDAARRVEPQAQVVVIHRGAPWLDQLLCTLTNPRPACRPSVD